MSQNHVPHRRMLEPVACPEHGKYVAGPPVGRGALLGYDRQILGAMRHDS